MAHKTIAELLQAKSLIVAPGAIVDSTLVNAIVNRIEPSYIRHLPAESIVEAKKNTAEQSLEQRIPVCGGSEFLLALVCDENHWFANQIMTFEYDPFGIYSFKGFEIRKDS